MRATSKQSHPPCIHASKGQPRKGKRICSNMARMGGPSCMTSVLHCGFLTSMHTMEQQGNFIPGVKIWSNLSYPLQGEDLYVKHWWEPISGASKQF